MKAATLPVYRLYLDVLVCRQDWLTTMIWGWQGGSKRRVSPAQHVQEQDTLPFPFHQLRDAKTSSRRLVLTHNR